MPVIRHGFLFMEFLKNFRKFIAGLIYPELFELENQNKTQMQFVFNLSNKWKEDVKAKERGINKLNKKIKYLNNQVSKLQNKNDNSI